MLAAVLKYLGRKERLTINFLKKIYFLCFFLTASTAFAGESAAPLSDQQEALLKLFLPSLSSNPSHSAMQQIKVGGINKDTANLISLQSIAVMGNMTDTQLVIRLPKKPYYELSSDDSHQILTLTLDDIDPASALPQVDIDNTAIRKIVFNLTPTHQFVVTLLLTPTVDVKGLNMIGDQPTELVLDVGTQVMPSTNATPTIKNIKTPGPYRPLVKKLEPLSPDDVLETTIEKAVNLLNQNKPSQSLKLLKLDLPPEVNTHLNYYTVLAEAYRQSGQALAAIKIYQMLLNNQPDNATFWVGLGMCFEMLHQNGAAQDAYSKANSLGNLSPTLSEYVSKQLTTGA